MINVSELKSYSEIGYNYLMNDIDQYNKDIDSINELKKQERNKANSILKAQRERVIKLINSGVCFIVNEEVLEF
jgi:signal transduction histidine kinase